jgi:S-DNA-T family DNA segregation ATPase FtsK/SpoIIIE
MKLLKKNLNFLTLIEIGYKVVKETTIDAAFVAEAVNISYDMAHKYIDVLAKNKVIGGPDDDGKYSVFLTEAGFEDKISKSELKIGDKGEEREFDFASIFPEANEPIDILQKTSIRQVSFDNLDEEIKKTADTLIEAFSCFGVTVSITAVDVGPRLLRFVVVPAKGVKVSSVLNLQDDIALYLAADSLRIEAPIPGRNAIGIEVPRNKPETVYLTELLDCDEVKNATAPTAAPIGKDIEGRPVLIDLAKMPHTLIGGATGMGKSCLIDCIITSIAKNATPDEVKFILIDPKMVEFARYKGLPHLLSAPIHGIPEIIGALKWATDEMERRYKLYQEAMVVRLKDYNKNAPEGKTLPEIVIVIDELADLMMRTRHEAEAYIARLAQKSRAAGIYLVIATQRPAVNVITGALKANIPARICFKTPSSVDSRTVLDMTGAEKLLGRGDMLIATPGAIKPMRVQGAFISDEEINRIIAPMKTEDADFDTGLAKAMEMGKKLLSIKKDEDDEEHEKEPNFLSDPKFLEAVDVALTQGQISTALLQRRLSIGFGKAARYIDAMEAMGIVSEKCGAKPRVVLLTREEWANKFARAEI